MKSHAQPVEGQGDGGGVNITLDLRERGCENGLWMKLAQDHLTNTMAWSP